MLVLVLNAGSSSQKSCLYDFSESIPNDPLKSIWKADIDWISELRAAVRYFESF